MSYTVYLSKEDFKFSCSHFTLWGPDSAERLHGHNYYVSVEIELEKIDENLGLAFDFNLIKPLMRELTSLWDEYVLLPKNSPYLNVSESSGQVHVIFNKKKYQLPAEDVRLLNCTNITAEELARLLAEALASRLRGLAGMRARASSLTVTVEETRGQRVGYSLKFE